MTSPASRSPEPLSAGWQDISTAPKDRPIVGWCVHEADPYHLDEGRLTLYGGHVEGLSHVENGAHVLVWGGSWDDRTHEYDGGYMPEWWFLQGSEFEVAANPTHWMPLPEPPADTTLSGPQRISQWVTVPREPTSDMLAAADSAIPRFEEEIDGSRLMGVDGALDAWKAMLAVSPSPEMGEISRDDAARIIDPRAWEFYDRHVSNPVMKVARDLEVRPSRAKADLLLSKLKENGLSREELGGLAQSQPGAAGPSDCAEGDARLSDGGAA